MNLVKNKARAFSSLILFSFFSFIIWRIEIEFHGWKGLIWLSYFHIAIPTSLFIFIIWVNVFFNFEDWKKRMIINSLLLFWIITGAIIFILSLQTTFIYGPQAMFFYFLPKWKIYLIRFIAFFIVPLFPLISLSSLRFIKIKIPKLLIFLSQVIFLSAFPFSILLLEITAHKGYPDIIHAVKSGFVFPFLFFSLGLPLIYGYLNKEPIHKVDNPFILDDLI